MNGTLVALYTPDWYIVDWYTGEQTDLCQSSSKLFHMERPTGRCHLSTISAHLQKTTKTASVSTFIS